MDMPTDAQTAVARPKGVLTPARLRAMDADVHAFCEIFADPDPTPAGAPGPLAGLGFAAKEVIHQAGRRAGWGVDFLQDRRASETASAVARLKAAGACCVGVTRSTVLAIAGEAATYNPRDPALTPGGSSAGSAAAVAAGMVDFALGTQTVGSIIRPAAYCGVVGFKPGFGVIPTDGTMVLSAELDHVGLIGRDVATIRAAFAVFAPKPSAPQLREIVVPHPWFTCSPPPEWGAALVGLRAAAQRLGLGWRPIELPREVTDHEARVTTQIVEKELHDNFGGFIVQNASRLPAKLAAMAARGAATDAAAFRKLLQQRDAIRARMAASVPPDAALLLPSAIDRPPRRGSGTGLRDPQRLATLIGWPALGLPVIPRGASSCSAQLISCPGTDHELLWLGNALSNSLESVIRR